MANIVSVDSGEIIRRAVVKKQPLIAGLWIVLLTFKTLFEVWIFVDAIKHIMSALLGESGKSLIILYKEYAVYMFIYITLFFVCKGIEFHITRCGNIIVENMLFKHLFSLETWYIGFEPGAVLAKLRVDISKAITAEITLIITFVDMAVCVVVGTFYAISLNRIVYFICIAVVIAAYSVTYNSYKKMPEIEKKAGNFFNRNYSNVWEIVANTEIVQFLDERRVLKNFDETAKENVENAVMKGKSYANVNISKKIINVGLVFLVCVVGAYITYGSDNLVRDIANITALVVLIPQIANALLKTFDLNVLHKEYQGICERLDAFTLLKEYSEEAKQLFTQDIQKLVVKNVSFAYGENKILKNINCFFEKGKMYYLSGDSGAGKSTFIKLLMGLLPLRSGTIFYDEFEIYNINRKSLWEKITYVAQEPTIIRGNIEKNILLNNERNDKRLTEALNVSTFDSLHIDLKKEVDGQSLSSGEKQKVCLARAIYENKGILILDEATSQMDPTSQTMVYERLYDYCIKNNVMVIVVNHNKSVMPLGSITMNLEEGCL